MKVTKMVIDKPLIRVTRDIDKLREENKKQKEVLDKVKEYIKNNQEESQKGYMIKVDELVYLLEEIE